MGDSLDVNYVVEDELRGKNKPSKRKHDEDEDDGSEQPDESESEQSRPSKKKARTTAAPDLRSASTRDQAAAFWAIRGRGEPSGVPEGAFVAVKDRSVGRLPELLRTCVGASKIKQAATAAVEAGKGRGPVVLVVAPSAERTLEFIQTLRKLRPRTAVAKLFARHIKVSEHESYLGSSDVRFAVGTPARLRALADSGSLRADRLAVFVVDVARDLKNRDVFDMAKDDMVALYDKLVHDRLLGGKTKLVLF